MIRLVLLTLAAIAAIAAIASNSARNAVRAHEWYEGRCCSGQDCRPVNECILPDGKQGLEYVPGACTPIDWSRVQNMPAPDGQWHACIAENRMQDGDALRCIYAPGAA